MDPKNFRGKKLFEDLVNKSATRNMYPVVAPDEGGKELFFSRQH